HPSLAATTRGMGEMPADLHGKPGSVRWAIPVALLAIVAIAIVYEFARPLAEYGKAIIPDKNATAPSAPSAPGAPTSGAPSVPDVTPTAPPQLPSGNKEVAGSEAPAARAETVATPSAPAADMPLVFVFRGTSWIE